MHCPYCLGTTNFDNSNLNHKYKHHDCNLYFKHCSNCDTIYAEKDKLIYKKKTNVISVENILEIDVCLNCRMTWLPDFPTSWTRSLTHIGKIHEIIQDAILALNNDINSDDLLLIQRTNNGVIYNHSRANSRGVEEYIGGSQKRRMNEYIAFLEISQLIKRKSIDGKFIKIETLFGRSFATEKDPVKLLAYFISMFANMKINNGYQRNQRTSVYKFFRINFLRNLLLMLEEKSNNGATSYDLGLAILSRDEKQFINKSLKYANTYNEASLKRLFFGETNRELNRAVISTFINTLCSLGLIVKNKKKYYITELGQDILGLLKDVPVVWMEQLGDTDTIKNKVAAKIILWRLLRANLITEENITVTKENLEKDIGTYVEIEWDNIKDIQFNLYYDEPKYNNGVDSTGVILREILSYLKGDFHLEVLEEYVEFLPVQFYNNILDVILNHEEDLEQILDKIKSDFISDAQSGRKWHEYSKELLINSGLDCIDYKDNPLFNKLTINKLKLNLPGGTIYNPDMLIMEESYGEKGCILVDAKDANSINSEVHKLLGYNNYASDSNVDTYCLITLNGELPKVTEERILEEKVEFTKISIINDSALEYVAKSDLDRNDVLEILEPKEGFKYITVDSIEQYKQEKVDQ